MTALGGALLAGMLLFPARIPAQSKPTLPRRVVAVRAQGIAPRVDGRLDDSVWVWALPAGDFVLREPTEGAAAPERTEVRFVYTHDALYVGARMYSDAPGAVRALVARRDQELPSEQLVVSLDTRGDRITAFSFAVTPGGVRLDYHHPSDVESSRDYSYDPVWQAETAVDSIGWTAELMIPFNQLRFNRDRELVWGLNLVRRVPARNEVAYWVLVRRNETGWSSRMGQLGGIAEIPASRRLELAPYLAADAVLATPADPADPFASRRELGARAGGDLKMGLGPNLTLDGTFDPDFGQVEADPAVVNLTAFETGFPERRPFFIEGADRLGGRGTFYSRRIGAPPPGSSGADYAETRDNTTILGATKVTGRLASGLSLGGLAAVTARETVRTFNPADQTYGRAVVAPLTAFGVLTTRQEFGRDRSTVGASLSLVERDLERGSPLATRVARHAYSGFIDGRLRWAGGKYDMSAYIGGSYVAGDSAAILAQQFSSRRYYQRPDAGYVGVDPRRTSLSGITAGINHSKNAGNWLWDIDYTHESPGLELNDLGSLGTADDRGLFTNLRYRRTRPGGALHRWVLGAFESAEWNFGGTRTFTELGVFGDLTFRNFWQAEFEFNVLPRSHSDNLTRGGPLMQTPLTWRLFTEFAGPSGARTRWSIEPNVGVDELDGWFATVEGFLSLRPAARWELVIEPRYARTVTPRQFVATRPDGGPATFGGRYIFGRVDRSEVVVQLRLNYALKPDLTLEAYLEPFASSGRYRDLGELAAARSFALRPYGGDGTSLTRQGDSVYVVTDGPSQFTFPVPDFDIRSLRSNLVLRWEWMPGSTAFLVWQQDRFRREIPRETVGIGGIGEAFQIPGSHFLALKVSYWIGVR